MDQVWEYYNTLPTLQEANAKFKDRKQTFSGLQQLLFTHENKFGVCLVHAHCELSEGEIMLAEGDKSQPTQATESLLCYPERWLPSGQPYEFTTLPTQTPPSDLIKEFRALTRNCGILGLFYTGLNGFDDHPYARIERTEGRTSFTRQLQPEDWDEGAVDTAWILRGTNPVSLAMACIVVCESRTTRSGAIHTGKVSCVRPNANEECNNPLG